MRIHRALRELGLYILIAMIPISVSAQTYATVLSFNGTTAAGPATLLTLGIDGSLYGTTEFGGTGTCNDNGGISCGVVFKITQHGEFKVLYNFQANGPTNPTNGLVLGDDGDLYGSTLQAVFKITKAGVFTTLYTFTGGAGGSYMQGGLIQGVDRNFYGTTSDGGAPSNSCPQGCGTIFKMTPAGAVTTLYSFCPQNYCPDGEYPVGQLAQGRDGSFYGTTYYGGLYKTGTIFKISSSGAFKLLYTFDGYRASYAGMILGTDGNFYGGGSDSIYQFTPEGVLTVFPVAFGGGPSTPIIQGSDGNFYDTVNGAGQHNLGMIFEMPFAGTSFTTLYSFTGYPDDGSTPLAGLTQATSGVFYGTTFTGGPYPCNYGSPGCGTVFSIDTGLAPFVAFVNRAARVAGTFGVLGQGLKGATSVSLNGTAANFTVVSDTFLRATVPAGATTGYVTVTTPSGTLTSNAPFYVMP
jgi:uncharacterized repeat protein (TIGR03803 family)